MYLSYESYIELGGTVDEALFNRLVYRAIKEIDRLTQKRICNDTDESKLLYAEDLKMLMFEMTVVYQMDNLTLGEQTIASESNDGVSISYREIDSEKINIAVNNIVTSYLSDHVDYTGTYLLSLAKAVPKSE